MLSNYQQLLELIGKEKLILNEQLSGRTSFQIGGPADLFLSVATNEDLIAAVKAARKTKVKFFILGGGTNILVSDKGFRGLVIENRTNQIKLLGWKGNIKSRISRVAQVSLQVESGVPTNRLVRFCLNVGIGGLESFLGLPGTVGGALYGNAHFGKQYFNNQVASLTFLNSKNELEKTTADKFEKRKNKDKNLVIISAVFNLRKNNKQLLWQKAEQSLKKRKSDYPLDFHNAGCIFKNISQAEVLRLSTPGFSQSTGFLIDVCGLKGKQIGQVKVSEKHANFIVNLGGAKAADVVKLITIIKKEVLKKFNLKLEEEIIKVGEF